MTTNWLRRVESLVPFTVQEKCVRDLLLELRLPFEPHFVFESSSGTRVAVDFLVLRGDGLVLECTFCNKKRGAVGELRRRVLYVDYRLGLLKEKYPKLQCAVLVEAPRVGDNILRRGLSNILMRADFLALSVEELRGFLLRGVSLSGSC